jgi:predicted ATPase/DNA-binding XRE family transcriptional regulator
LLLIIEPLTKEPAAFSNAHIIRCRPAGTTMDEEVSFGYWLKQRRDRLDLTQDQFARQVGCATSTLQKIEAGRRRPSPEFAGRLAIILRVEPDKRPAFVEFARGGQELAGYELFRPPTNLPAGSTPLIGREDDVANVRRRLMRDDTRLVTLVGPPGIGKTRLSLQVAAEVRDRFDDGVYFVPLAPVSDRDLVTPAIVKILGLRESAHRAPVDRLCHYLRFRRMLLVLDNFEQVVAAAPLLAELLAACPRLKLLVTSRMPLRLRAERQYPVPLLALPELTPLPPAGELTRYAAVALFADRAEAVKPDFTITEDNASAVATLCYRLDGLPLAIELISARVTMLPPSELLARLGGPLLLGSDGLRDVDERQRTLRDAIEWSYNLLDSEERSLFARLGVFVGGWTLDAAESVQRHMEAPAQTSTLDLLASLVEKSLVMQLHFNGETRFTMLETIREHALEQLESGREAEAVRRCHAAYYLSHAEAVTPQMHTSARLVNQVEREHDNLRVALQWSLDRGQLDTVCRLAAALIWLWVIHTWHLSEGRKWLDRALAAARDAGLPPLAQARLHQDAGLLAYLQGDHVAARGLHRGALALARVSKDKAMIAHALHGLSNAAMNQGQYEEVTVLLEECLPLARTTGEKWLEAVALNNLAEVARLQGEFERAGQMYEAGLSLLSELGDKYFTPILLDGLGLLAQYQGDYERALTIHARCLALGREMGDRRIIALALEKLAGVAAGQDQAERAARLLGAAEALREAIHIPVETIDLTDYDRFVEMTRARLDEDTLARAWAGGRAMGLEQAIIFALAGGNRTNVE